MNNWREVLLKATIDITLLVLSATGFLLVVMGCIYVVVYVSNLLIDGLWG